MENDGVSIGEGTVKKEAKQPIRLASNVIDELQPQDFKIIPAVDRNGKPIPNRVSIAMHTGLETTKNILDLEKKEEDVYAYLQRSLQKGANGSHRLDMSSYQRGLDELESLLGEVTALTPEEQPLALAASVDHAVHTILGGRKGVYNGLQNMAPGRNAARENPYVVKYVQVVQGGLPSLGKR